MGSGGIAPNTVNDGEWSTWRLGVFAPWRSPFTSAIEHESGWAIGLVLTLRRRRQLLVFKGSNCDISVSQSSHNPGLLSRLPSVMEHCLNSSGLNLTFYIIFFFGGRYKTVRLTPGTLPSRKVEDVARRKGVSEQSDGRERNFKSFARIWTQAAFFATMSRPHPLYHVWRFVLH